MKIFVAGATGATGRVFVPLASPTHELVLHVRPQTAGKSPLGKDPRARVFDLSDAAALREALTGCAAVLSLVGTMRSRFQSGDTYESSDIASTGHLVNGAVDAGVPRMLLLSSIGAGGPGAYLKMKGRCEDIVQKSPLRFTLFRPSTLVSPDDPTQVSHHGRRAVPGAVSGAFALLRNAPGLSGPIDDVRPIPITVLCRAFLRVLEDASGAYDGQVLAGRDLWRLGAEEKT